MITDAGFLAVGIVAGLLHFTLLRWNVALYARAGRVRSAAVLQALRLGALAGLFAMAALHGALPLLLTALGLLIARPFVMHWMATS